MMHLALRYGVITLTILFGLFLSIGRAHALQTPTNTGFCPHMLIQVDDGDTFLCGRETIRVLGIDTPEIKHTDHGIDRDQPYGRKAAKFTQRALEKAGQITLLRHGTDRYGRTLAHVFLDGELLSVRLIEAGLAYETISQYGVSGPPELAQAITNAAKASPAPKFQRPATWREKYQKKGSAPSDLPHASIPARRPSEEPLENR